MTSLRTFAVRMYEEHLEEASFLYTQRLALLANPELAWTALDDFEQRLEAHLDALLIGGLPALEVCRRRAAEGDAGELFAAVSVYCRHQDGRLLADTWRALDFGDEEKVRAVTTALKNELPVAWQPACEQAILRGDGRLLPLLAEVCGYRRINASGPIAQRIAQDSPTQTLPLWALSRMPGSPATDTLLLKLCGGADATLRFNAALALLRQGKRNELRRNESAQSPEFSDPLAMSLYGDRQSAAALRKQVEAGAADSTALMALGILGDVTVIRALLNLLADEERGATAALALYWITGARLFENVFVAEEVDEASLFDTELRVWRERRELPKRADGKPFGDLVTQLSRDPARWSQWLTAHASQFNPEYRYRRGQLYSARSLLGCLLESTVPQRWRQLAYEELCIRYKCTIPFEADYRVREQRSALAEIAGWVAHSEAHFDSGRW